MSAAVVAPVVRNRRRDIRDEGFMGNAVTLASHWSLLHRKSRFNSANRRAVDQLQSPSPIRLTRSPRRTNQFSAFFACSALNGLGRQKTCPVHNEFWCSRKGLRLSSE